MVPAIGVAISAAAAAVDAASSLTQPAAAKQKKKTGIQPQPFNLPGAQGAKASMPAKASVSTVLSPDVMSVLMSAQKG